MNNTTPTLWIYTAALVLVLLPFALFSYIKKAATAPKLSIEVFPDESYVKKKWLTQGNGTNQPEWIYEVGWKYKLVIRNQSKHEAYYLKLHTNHCMPYYSHLSVLNHYVPVAPNESTEIEGTYIRLEQCQEGKHTQPNGIPAEFDRVKLLLEYRNKYKFRFYTTFDFKYKLNTTTRSRPTEFA